MDGRVIACLSVEVEILYSFVFYEVVYYILLHFCRIIFEVALAGLEHFKNGVKWFLFHLQSSFRS